MNFHDRGKAQIAVIVLEDVIAKMGTNTEFNSSQAAVVAAVAKMLEGAVAD